LDGSTTIPSVWFGPDNDVGTPELLKLKLEISFTAVANRNDGLGTGGGQLVQLSEPPPKWEPKHPDIVNKERQRRNNNGALHHTVILNEPHRILLLLEKPRAAITTSAMASRFERRSEP